MAQKDGAGDGLDPITAEKYATHNLALSDLLEDNEHHPTHHGMTRDAHHLGLADFASARTGAGGDLAEMERTKAAEVKGKADHAARMLERGATLRRLEERREQQAAREAHAKAHADSLRAMSHGLLEVVAQHNKEEEARREAAAWEVSLALFAKQRREAKMWFNLRPYFDERSGTDRWHRSARGDPKVPRFDPATGVPLNRTARALLASLSAPPPTAEKEGTENEGAEAEGGGAQAAAAAAASSKVDLGFDDSKLEAAAAAAAAAAGVEARAAARAALARQRELDTYVPPPPPTPRYDPRTGVALNALATAESKRIEELVELAGFEPFGEEQQAAVGGMHMIDGVSDGSGNGDDKEEAMEEESMRVVSAAGWRARARRREILDATVALARTRAEAAEAARIAADPTTGTYVNFLGRRIRGVEPDPNIAVYDKVTNVPLNRPARKERALFIEWGRRRAPPDPRYDPKTGVPLNKEAREELARKDPEGRQWILA